jgi:hypothetical protein
VFQAQHIAHLFEEPFFLAAGPSNFYKGIHESGLYPNRHLSTSPN